MPCVTHQYRLLQHCLALSLALLLVSAGDWRYITSLKFNRERYVLCKIAKKAGTQNNDASSLQLIYGGAGFGSFIINVAAAKPRVDVIS